MDLERVIAELRLEKKRLDEAILSLEKLEALGPKRRLSKSMDEDADEKPSLNANEISQEGTDNA